MPVKEVISLDPRCHHPLQEATYLLMVLNKGDAADLPPEAPSALTISDPSFLTTLLGVSLSASLLTFQEVVPVLPVLVLGMIF